MVFEGLDVGTAAGYSGRYSAGVTTETASEKKQRKRFESARTSKTSYSYGSNIPSNGSATAWASKSSDDPMPINMDITALPELMTEEFLGNTGIDYEKLKKLLIDYLTQYCSKLVNEGKAKDCMSPTRILLSFCCQHFASCLQASLLAHFHLNSFNPSAVLLHFFTGSQCISLISYIFYHLVVNASRLPPAYFRLRMYSNEYNENVGVKNECQLILAQRNLDAMVQQDRKMLGKQRGQP